MTNGITLELIAAVMRCAKRSIERRAARERWPYTEQPCRGGRRRIYRVDDLPADVQAKVILNSVSSTGPKRPVSSPDGQVPSGDVFSAAAQEQAAGGGSQDHAHTTPAPSAPAGLTDEARAALWRWYDTRPQDIKDVARSRLPAVQAVRRLIDTGMNARQAMRETAHVLGVPEPTLRRWWYGDGSNPGCCAAHPSDYLPLLAPRWAGRAEEARIDPSAWDALLADYLRPEQPALLACYRRLRDAALRHGWRLPSYATIARRVESLPWQAVVLAREGEAALKRRLPHVARTKGHLAALQAVNADGHVFDLRVRLPSGEVGRPVLAAWQDIYSGKVLAWRTGETLSSHLVRLAFGDVVERYGVPEHVYLDNGREFAAKALTGGARTRFRFVIRDDDPVGLFTQLGITVHWTTPYHGQAKPIERAFRDLCEGISRHPAAAGAYTGNSPNAKPANYGERVLGWDEFVRLVDAGIAEHNARSDRRSANARGRSFDAVFNASYASAVIRRPTDEQRRLWLLAAEGVTVRATGHVAIAGNAYWGEQVAALAGRRVMVRFDPDRLDRPVHVYTIDGAYVGAAERTAAAFDDVEAARQHARAHRQALRAAKQMQQALTRKEALAAVAHLPGAVPDSDPPAPAAVRIMPAPRRRQPEPLAAATGTDDYVGAADRIVLAALEQRRRKSPDEG